MPCDLETVQAAACESGFGKVESEVALLQLIAQNAAAWVAAVEPGSDISVDAIMERACTSGYAKVTDPITLYQITAQNICGLIT